MPSSDSSTKTKARTQQQTGLREKGEKVLKSPKRKHSRSPQLVSVGLLFSGIAALILSVIYEQTIPAFIGLGLLFWGALLLYIKPKGYVKANLLHSTSLSTLATVDQIIGELGYKGKATYLPPRTLKDFKGGKAVITSLRNVDKSTITEAEKAGEGKLFLKNPSAICLTPPGLDLANLYEDELGKSFTVTDLKDLQDNLPKLFVEDLEIAEDVEISKKRDVIHIRITGSIYQDFCKEARKLSNVCNSLGCPLCSSIAIALTRATGKPIIIERNEPSEDGKIIEAYYRIMEE